MDDVTTSWLEIEIRRWDNFEFTKMTTENQNRIKVKIEPNPNSTRIFRKHISFILNSNGACPYGKAELCFLRIILFDDNQERVEIDQSRAGIDRPEPVGYQFGPDQ